MGVTPRPPASLLSAPRAPPPWPPTSSLPPAALLTSHLRPSAETAGLRPGPFIPHGPRRDLREERGPEACQFGLHACPELRPPPPPAGVAQARGQGGRAGRVPRETGRWRGCSCRAPRCAPGGPELGCGPRGQLSEPPFQTRWGDSTPCPPPSGYSTSARPQGPACRAQGGHSRPSSQAARVQRGAGAVLWRPGMRGLQAVSLFAPVDSVSRAVGAPGPALLHPASSCSERGRSSSRGWGGGGMGPPCFLASPGYGERAGARAAPSSPQTRGWGSRPRLLPGIRHAHSQPAGALPTTPAQD